MVYNRENAYPQEARLQSWLARLDELAAFAENRVSALYPGRGSDSGLSLIAQTRAYLYDFADAVKARGATVAERQMLAKYPDCRVRQIPHRVQSAGVSFDPIR